MTFPLTTLQQLRPLLVGFRKEAGLSQAAIAARLGITQQSYARIEANPSATSVERLFTILRLLGAEIAIDRIMTPAADEFSEGVAFPDPASPAVSAPVQKPASAAPRKLVPPTMKKESW